MTDQEMTKVEKLAQARFCIREAARLLADAKDGIRNIPFDVYTHFDFLSDYIEAEADVKYSVNDEELRMMGFEWWIEHVYS